MSVYVGIDVHRKRDLAGSAWPATLTAAGITNAAAAAGVSGRYLCRRDRCRNYCRAATADAACLMRFATGAGCET